MGDRKLAEMMGMDTWYCPWCNKHLPPTEVTYEEDCALCGFHLTDPDFSSPEWRARLMDFCVEQEWWDRFREWVDRKHYHAERRYSKLNAEGKCPHCVIAYLWRNLPDLVVEYRGGA